MKLAGRHAVITGAGKGLGKIIAKRFVEEGASVFLTGRDEEALEQTKKEISVNLQHGQRIISYKLDISIYAEIDKFLKYFYNEFSHLDILVNNAGINGPLGYIEDVNWGEWVDCFNTNLFGPVYLTRSFLPDMKKRNYGKIIFLSGGGATSPLPAITAYAASKVALIRFAESLSKELSNTKIDVNSIAPGIMKTRITEEYIELGSSILEGDFIVKIKEALEKGGVPLEKPADLAVYLASEEINGMTGRLISAAWDPWPFLEKEKENIKNTDVYTLRRTTPSIRK